MLVQGSSTFSLVFNKIEFEVINLLCVQVLALRDVIRPPQKENFTDVYIVYELMDTDFTK